MWYKLKDWVIITSTFILLIPYLIFLMSWFCLGWGVILTLLIIFDEDKLVGKILNSNLRNS